MPRRCPPIVQYSSSIRSAARRMRPGSVLPRAGGIDAALGKLLEHPARVGPVVRAPKQLRSAWHLGHRISCSHDEDARLVACEPARVRRHGADAGDQDTDRVRRQPGGRTPRGQVIADPQPEAGRAQRPRAAPHRVERRAVETKEPPVGPAGEALRRPIELSAAIDAGDHVDRHRRPAIGSRERPEAGHGDVELDVERGLRPEAVDAILCLAHRISAGAQKRYCSKRPNGSDEQISVMNVSMR